MKLKENGMLFLFLLSIWKLVLPLYGSGPLVDPIPESIILNPCPIYSLINSVSYHPDKNLFCATYTQGNKVVLYKQDISGKPRMIQMLNNPSAKLSQPQHAIFSNDGQKIIVANWENQTLAIYQSHIEDFYDEIPISIIPFSQIFS